MNKHIIDSLFSIKFAAGILAFTLVSASAAELPKTKPTLSFEKAVKAAQKNDPWLTGNVHKQRAIESMSRAVNTLADPKVSLGLTNLPMDGFDFGQEGMTQAKIGISQIVINKLKNIT